MLRQVQMSPPVLYQDDYDTAYVMQLQWIAAQMYTLHHDTLYCTELNA